MGKSSIIKSLLVSLFVLSSFGVLECQQPDKTLDATTAPIYTYSVVNRYPHDPTSFTQGLVFDEGYIFESSGLYDQSSLRKVDLSSGEISTIHNLASRYFGEGLTIIGDNLFQLTWKSHKGFIYNNHDLSLNSTFSYQTEGWGLTTDGTHLLLSDGTNRIYFLDPVSFEVGKCLDVRDGNQPVKNLNELEFIEGEIFANVWKSDRIACISPETGQVLRWIDLTGLLDKPDNWSEENVLNGIAYDHSTERLFVTGKRWPHIFEIEVVLQASD